MDPGAGTNHARLRRLLQRWWRHSGDTRRHPSLQGMEDPNDRLNFRSVMRFRVATRPRGSMYPVFKDSAPKYHSGYGFWDQSP